MTRIVAVDPRATRRAAAAMYGADVVLDGVDDETAPAIAELTGGQGAEVVIDLVGTDETIAAGLASTRRRGAVALVGAGGGTVRRPWWGTLPLDAEIFTFQGGGIADVHAVVDLAERGAVRLDVEPFDLRHVADAYDRLERGVLRGRAVVRPMTPD